MTRHKTFFWVTVLYFIQGLPMGVFAEAAPVFLRLHGVSRHAIGLLHLLNLPWLLKVLWSPVVDRVGTLRRWIFGGLLALSLVHLGFALLAQQNPLPRSGVYLFALGMAVLAVASATQDIAIDASFIRLMKPGEEGWGNGLRVSAYRVAMMLGGGGSIYLAARLAWPTIFAVLAFVFVLLAGLLALAPSQTSQGSQATFRAWAASLWTWLKRPHALAIFAFILLYKLGDATMGAMVKVYWVDMGMQPREIGFINTTLGIGMTIAGALAGGAYTSRKGIYQALWVLGFAQAFSNLGYAAVAFAYPDPATFNHLALYAASVVESFTAGLGMAALLAFLTRICDTEHAGTQFAALSAVFGLTRAMSGAMSGELSEWMSYGAFFLLTFFLSFPAYILLPRIKPRLAA